MIRRTPTERIRQILNNAVFERMRYPLYQLKHGPLYGNRIVRILRDLRQTQWLSSEEIGNLQSMKLRKLMDHAYRHVPYYREIMRAARLKPEDFRTSKDLENFPVLTKQAIRENLPGLLSDDINKRNVFHASTGGSTGEPLKYVRDRSTLLWTDAAELRGLSWGGYALGDVFVDLMSPGWPSLLGKVRSRVMNRYCFPAFANESQLMKHLEMIKLLRPRVLFGYPSNLYRIVTMWQACDSLALRVPMILTTGEMLYGHQREYLHQRLAGEVYDYYGCNEVGSIAFECEYHVKHVSDERLCVEITDEAGKLTSALGDITVTDLDNYAMPFIRYKNGDTGTILQSGCRCGRGLTVLTSVDGRAQEYLKAIDGNYVPAIFFPAAFRSLKGIDQYQIIQLDERTIILKIVKNGSFSNDELAGMKQKIKEHVGESAVIKVEECMHIPLSRIGKTRHVISHVPFEMHKAASVK